VEALGEVEVLGPVESETTVLTVLAESETGEGLAEVEATDGLVEPEGPVDGLAEGEGEVEALLTVDTP
jgi:hypothetical protein